MVLACVIVEPAATSRVNSVMAGLDIADSGGSVEVWSSAVRIKTPSDFDFRVNRTLVSLHQHNPPDPRVQGGAEEQAGPLSCAHSFGTSKSAGVSKRT